MSHLVPEKEQVMRIQPLGFAAVIVVVLSLAASGAFAADAPAAAAPAAAATQPAAAAFEKIKALAGDWKGKKADGGEVATSFKVAAAKSAVVEDMHMDMVSVYTVDSDRLVMTHYCAAQNQPRMVADAIQPDANSLSFHFLDATGMKSPDEGH